MSARPISTANPRYLLIGTGGHFTRSVLQSLLELGAVPQAYWQYAGLQRHPPELAGIKIETPAPVSPIADLLEQHAIESREHAGEDLEQQLADIDSDFLLVACWPQLISERALASVRQAALNLHPSLLPRYPGIDPVGEQLRAAERALGVSLHLLSDRFDQGDLIAQQGFTLPGKASRIALESRAAQIGAGLFKQALERYPRWDRVKQV